MHVAENFAEDFSERIYPTSLIKLLNDGKQLGEKTGSGFYKFDKKRKASPNPDLASVIAQSRKVGLSPRGSIRKQCQTSGACNLGKRSSEYAEGESLLQSFSKQAVE